MDFEQKFYENYSHPEEAAYQLGYNDSSNGNFKNRFRYGSKLYEKYNEGGAMAEFDKSTEKALNEDLSS